MNPTAESREKPAPNPESPYSKLLEEQLNEERARKDSLERRAAALVSSSAFLVTVLFGAVVWVTTPSRDVALPDDAKVMITSALVALVVAAAAGIFGNQVRNYKEMAASQLPDLLARLDDEPRVAEERVFRLRSKILVDARQKNTFKASCLTLALYLQLFAAVLISLAVLRVGGIF